jgi:hypothetical protein
MNANQEREVDLVVEDVQEVEAMEEDATTDVIRIHYS